MSDDVATLVTLLERWRDGNAVQRVGVAVEASSAIRELSPAAKRELAAEIAERVAPQLVPQIRAEDGDLTPEQVGAVVDLLRRADREQLDDLVTALRTGDVDGSLSLVEDAVAAVAPIADAATGEDVDERVAAAEARMDALLDRAIDAVDDEPEPPAEDEALPTPPPSAATPDAPAPAVDELDEEAVREAAMEAAAARAVAWRDTSAEYERPPVTLPSVSFAIDHGDLELPDPSVEEVAPLEQRLGELPGSPTTGTLDPPDRRPVAGLAPAPTPAVVAAITATPDGYRRRRAALAAIRDERLAVDDVLPVVRSLARPTARVWVAGAALDAGLLDPASLDGLELSASAVRRLTRRVTSD